VWSLQAAAAVASASWKQAAHAVGDFVDMAQLTYSENTYYSVLAAREIGENRLADSLTVGLASYVEQLSTTPAATDYFATSLPTVLLFDESPERRRQLTVDLLDAQVGLLTDDQERSQRAVARVLRADPTHELALELTGRLERTGSLP
jgi:hypothetical protein